MLTKTVTYTDFSGEEVTEELYFHLTKADIVELELKYKGGMEEWLKRVMAAEDGKAIFGEFKEIILFSYGKKSFDGRRFVKNDELREEFVSSEAFSVLVMDLLTDTDSAIEFFKGIMPSDVQVDAETNGATPPAEEKKEIRQVTRKELAEVSPEDFKEYQAQMLRGEVELVD